MLAEFMKQTDKNWDRASKIYQVNCDTYGYAKSCLEYGNYAFIGIKGKDIKPDPVEALKYFNKGCELGSGENCLNSGLLLVSPKLHDSPLGRDLPKVTFDFLLFPVNRVYNIGFSHIFQGMEYLSKSCNMNNGNACFYLSGMYLSGADATLSFNDLKNEPKKTAENFEIKQDLEKAFSLSVKACELKNLFACANLSQMYATGHGAKKDAEKAEFYLKKAEEMRRQEILTRFKHP